MPSPSSATEITAAQVLVHQAAWRRAKLVVLDLSTGDRLVVQPRFTGALMLAVYAISL